MDRGTISLANWNDVAYIWPLVILGLVACVIIVQDLFEEKQTWAAPFLALFGLAVAGLLLVIRTPHETKELFQGMAVADPFSWFFEAFFLVVAMLVVVLSTQSRDIKENKGEYYALIIVLTMGMIMLASANDLLMVYLALETVSIASYILTGWMAHSKRSSEASLKYVLYGAVASGLMLYGLSLLYGMTGSTDFHQVADKLATSRAPLAAGIASMLVFSGFAYKIASVPFHMWAPDVYTGAPTPVTAFLTVGPKAAGMAALIRFFYVVLSVPGVPNSDGMTWVASAGAPVWPILVGILAMATMTVGNLAAMGQNNVKRLLGYSSIAHAGYMLMGLVVLTQEGLRSILFYLVVYCAMNLGAFVVVSAVANETGTEEMEGFRGLGTRNPFSGICMTLFLFSLVGMPPLAGFAGKLHLFYGVVHKGMMVGGTFNFYYLIAIVGVLNSVISLFYYARIVKAMYLETVPEALANSPLFVKPTYYLLYAFLGFFTIYLGLSWGSWISFAGSSVSLMGSL